MTTTDDTPFYHIWGADHAAYGPVELPTLVNWIKDERVLGDTWIYVEEQGRWLRASQMPELSFLFKGNTNGSGTGSLETAAQLNLGIDPKLLRCIRVFADFTEDQLARIMPYLDIVSFGPGAHIVHKGTPSDALYAVIDGELRSCLLIDGIESPVATLSPGCIFGEVSMLDHGTHASDVIANHESTLLKVTAEAFERIVQEIPDVALPFLLALSRCIAGRARTLTRRYEDSVHLSQAAKEQPQAPSPA